MGRLPKQKTTILIVEDDPDQLARYTEMAQDAGLTAYSASTLDMAKTHLADKSIQYLLTDIHLQGPGHSDTYEGLTLISYLREHHPEILPLAMTSDPRIETYHRVLAAGALYLFRKPILTRDELMVHLSQADRGRRTGNAARRRHQQMLPAHLAERCPDGIVLEQAVRDRARAAALNPAFLPIILLGETGTGKEEVAKLIHRYRSAAEGPVPLVAVNCANLSGDTAVSALFGHRKGAFTGADQTTNGFIGDADGGFLFLDEIQTLSRDCQQRLLRVFNDGSYNRLGDTQTLYSDFRLIVATTRDLEVEVEEGRFLVDLFMRLTGINIRLKPLREGPDEFPLLVELAFARVGATVPADVLADFVKKCRQFYWQGNVRQLMLVISALVTEAIGNQREISVDDLPTLKTMLPPKPTGEPEAAAKAFTPAPADGEVLQTLSEALAGDKPLDDTLEAIEREILRKAFDRHGSLRSASVGLNVPKTRLWAKKIKYFGATGEMVH